MQLPELISLVLDTYINAPLIGVILAFSGFLNLIPSILCFYYYKKVNSLDYLIIGLINLSMFFDLAFIPLRYNAYSFEPVIQFLLRLLIYFPGVFAISLTILHCIRFKWGNNSKFLTGVFGIFIFLFLRATLKIFFYDLLIPYNDLLGLLLEIIRISVGSLWIYVYLSTEQVVKFDKLQNPRKLWILYGFTAIYIGVLNIAESVAETFLFPASFFEFVGFAINIGFFVSIFIIIMIASLYPEMFLLSEFQIFQARKLYEKAEMVNCDQKKVEKDRLLTYMCSYIREVKGLTNSRI